MWKSLSSNSYFLTWLLNGWRTAASQSEVMLKNACPIRTRVTTGLGRLVFAVSTVRETVTSKVFIDMLPVIALKSLWWKKKFIKRHLICASNSSLIAWFMVPTWGPSRPDRTQVGPMLAPWTLLSGLCWIVAVDLVKIYTSGNHYHQGVTGLERPRIVQWLISIDLTQINGFQ